MANLKDLIVNGSARILGTIYGNLTGNCSGSSGSCTGNSATATKATQDSDGVAINTNYAKRRGELTGAVDWNNYTDYGCYKVQQATMTSTYHAPEGEYSYGLLVVEKSNITHENRTVQIYYPHNHTISRTWTRTFNVSTWTGWVADVNTTGNQTVSGVKTFTGNPVFQASSDMIVVNNPTSGSSGAVSFKSGGTLNGKIGIQASTNNPLYWESSGTAHNLLRNSTLNTATGSTTQPVYIDANGVAQTCSVTDVRTVVQASSADILPSWWRVWSDGFIEQGGVTGIIADYGTATVSLLKSYSNTNYTIVKGTAMPSTGDDSNYNDASCIRYATKTVSSFQIYSRGAANGGRYVYWQTSGY